MYAFTPRSIHIFNSNQIPKLKSGLDSLTSRFVVIEFNKTFKQNPNPRRGELQADPRFHDSPAFLRDEVCPALLNRLLAELINLAADGIDYKPLDGAMKEIQEESTHLWVFADETGLVPDPDGRIWIGEFFEKIKQWYIDNGTLEIIEMDNGKDKRIWHDQANKYDANIKSSNQVYKRFKQLFPKIQKMRETQDPKYKSKFYILGLKFENNAQLLHSSDISIDIASPTAQLCSTKEHFAQPDLGGANSGAVVEQQTQSQIKLVMVNDRLFFPSPRFHERSHGCIKSCFSNSFVIDGIPH